MPESEALAVLQRFVTPSSDKEEAGKTNTAKEDPVAAVVPPASNTVTVEQPATEAMQPSPAQKAKKALPFLPNVPDIPNLPTPGGIGLLLVIVLVFLFAIVPMGATGQTRLELMWNVLAGKAHFASESQSSAQPFVPW